MARLPEDVEDAYPLSDLQLGMFYHTEFDEMSSVYHDVFSYRVRLTWDEALMAQALRRITARHPILRSSFHLSGFNEPLQCVHREISPRLDVSDLRQVGPEEKIRYLAAFADEERFAGFDINEAGLWRVHVHRESDDDFVFTLSFHHAILDGWSVATLLTELAQIYVSQLDAVDAVLPPPPPGYNLHIASERQVVEAGEAFDFWRGQLAGAPSPRLPFLREGQSHAKSLLMPIPNETHTALVECANAIGVPLRSLLLAGHYYVLSSLVGARRVTSGVVSSTRPETEDGGRMVGLFLNLLPLVAEVSGVNWQSFAQSLFREESEALRYRRLSLARIQEAAGRNDLFEVFFNYVQFHVFRDLPFDGLETKVADFQEETNYALEVQFGRDPDGRTLTLRLNYDSSVLPDTTVHDIAGQLTHVLALIAENPEAAMDDPWASATVAETDINDTDVDFTSFFSEPA